jgi:hypothetical protein
MVISTPVFLRHYILLNEDHQSKLVSLPFLPPRIQQPSKNQNNMAPSNALTVEEIINGFTNPILPKIDHEPTFEDIQVATRLLNANAISIPSMTGGGAHGHLGIIMTQVEYATISTSPWV